MKTHGKQSSLELDANERTKPLTCFKVKTNNIVKKYHQASHQKNPVKILTAYDEGCFIQQQKLWR